jgi:hypothetical protein
VCWCCEAASLNVGGGGKLRRGMGLRALGLAFCRLR